MKGYDKEVWIGNIGGAHGWNWKIKGVDAEDYKGRVDACNEFICVLKDMRDFYKRLVDWEKETPNEH